MHVPNLPRNISEGLFTWAGTNNAAAITAPKIKPNIIENYIIIIFYIKKIAVKG